MGRDFAGNGGGTYVDCGVTNDANGRLNFTVACWFQLDTQLTNANRLMSRWGANGNKSRYLLTAGTRLGLNIINSTGGSGVGVTGGTALVADGRWYHAAAKMTVGSPSAIRVYLNGVVDNTTFFTGPSTIDPTAAGGYYNLGLGADLDSHNFGIDGRIAEAAAWNADLTDNEILLLALGAIPSGIRPVSCIGYWPLWGAASPEPDLEPNANPRFNGTVTGATLAKHPPIVRPPRKVWTPAFIAHASLIKTIMGVAYPSNVKTIEGLAQASVKTVEGLT